MSHVVKYLFQIQEITPIKLVWICLFITAWIFAWRTLWRYRNGGFSTVFLRVYLGLWLFDVCKYQPWWNLQLQMIMDLALILAVLESIFGTFVILTRKDSLLTLIVTFIITLPRGYGGMSKMIYFSHLYTLGISAGVLSNSIIRNLRVISVEPFCSILFVWICAQLMSSTVGRSWWFAVGIAKLSVQILCLGLWYLLLGYQRRNMCLIN